MKQQVILTCMEDTCNKIVKLTGTQPFFETVKLVQTLPP